MGCRPFPLPPPPPNVARDLEGTAAVNQGDQLPILGMAAVEGQDLGQVVDNPLWKTLRGISQVARLTVRANGCGRNSSKRRPPPGPCMGLLRLRLRSALRPERPRSYAAHRVTRQSTEAR